MPVVMALATSGCASKGFVRAQIAATNSKVSALETKTNQQAEKEEADVSRLQEKLGTTDHKVDEVASAAQQANASAGQANQLAGQNQAAIATSQSAIAANTVAISTLDKSINYSLVATADVTFAFNKSNLSDADRAALDTLIRQFQSTPRAVFELLGFTDPVGAAAYNLTLSRSRAETVARYLVRRGIPLRSIRVIGLGKEPVPSDVLADVQAAYPNATAANSLQLARRVLIRIYTPNTSAGVQTSSLQ